MKPFIKESSDKNEEFQTIIKEFIHNETVQEMKKYRQHYETSCFDHCYMAAYYCFCICKKYQPDRKGFHAFTHGKKACENACKLFDLNEKEKDMIIKHMWPVTIEFPKSIEGFVLTLVDKYCALSESFDVFQTRLFTKQSFRYAYLFLSLIIIRL